MTGESWDYWGVRISSISWLHGSASQTTKAPSGQGKGSEWSEDSLFTHRPPGSLWERPNIWTLSLWTWEPVRSMICMFFFCLTFTGLCSDSQFTQRWFSENDKTQETLTFVSSSHSTPTFILTQANVNSTWMLKGPRSCHLLCSPFVPSPSNSTLT